jgi:uncharacterized protein
MIIDAFKIQVKNWLRWFNSKMPSEAYLKSHPHLKWISNHLHHNSLWHFTRQSVPRACFIGLFISCMPIPFQMLLAVLIAIPLRANVIITVVGCWLSNPVTIPPMLYIAYKIGKLFLQLPPQVLPDKITLTYLFHQLPTLWMPVMVGCISMGLFFGLLGYGLSHLFWFMYDRKSHDANTK